VLALPFRDESFGVVTCRLAAHRFAELLPVLRQVSRVLRRDGSLLFADVLGPDDSESASLLARVQKGREPGHVRAFRPIEWAAFLRAVGLTVIDEATVELRRDWDEWTASMSRDARAELDQIVRAAPARCRDDLGVMFSGGRIESFADKLLVLRADKD
jgi:SAM-dependent methyltransferase